MNMVDISSNRYTTKHYDRTKKISKEQIDKICTVLQNSPSSLNSQPWHFIVVESDEGKEKILPAIAEFNQQRIKNASHTIIMCIKNGLNDAHLDNVILQEDKDGRYTTTEDKQSQDDNRRSSIARKSPNVETQMEWERKQVYIALGHVLFAAAGMGIDSTAIEGFNAAKMDEVLDLKTKGLSSVVVAALGFRDENDSNARRPKSRLPKEQLFTFL